MTIVLALIYRGLAAAAGSDATVPTDDVVRLELNPKICTLSSNDKQCQADVRASWRSSRLESLCLIILERPEVKHCWENYSEGVYSIALVFAGDLTFQLRDMELRRVLSSEVLRIIREAIRYRHKRREPWNVFE